MRLLLVIAMLLSTCFAFANAKHVDFSYETSEIEELSNNYIYSDSLNLSVKAPKFQKLKAVLLAVFLGPFGVHRIYLGTKANVPVFYSLTLGGGLGILPILDIIAILSTKDLEQFKNSNKIFMWSKSSTNQ